MLGLVNVKAPRSVALSPKSELVKYGEVIRSDLKERKVSNDIAKDKNA